MRRALNYTRILCVLLFLIFACILFLFLESYSRDDEFPIEKLQENLLGDLKNFSFSVNYDVCGKKNVFILFVVTSHPKKRPSRDILRSAYNRKIFGRICKVAFMMGDVLNSNLKKDLMEENRINRDIIIGNYIDHYKNVTYMHLQGLKWGTMYCPQAEFIVKSDDDIFINQFKLIRKLVKFRSHFRKSVFCGLLIDTEPFRDPDHKYYISYEEYPWKKFPTYCNGWMVVYPRTIARQIDMVAPTVPMVWISDLFVTGLVLHKVKDFRFIDMYPDYTTDPYDLLYWLHSSNEMINFYVGPVDRDLVLLAALHYKNNLQHGY